MQIDALLAEIAATTQDGLEEVDSGAAIWPGGGVYVLYHEDGSVLYVGQSSNVRLRLKQHRDKNFHSVKVYHIDDLPSRLRIETILVTCLRPRLNRGIQLGLCGEKIWEIKWKTKGPGRRPARGRRLE